MKQGYELKSDNIGLRGLGVKKPLKHHDLEVQANPPKNIQKRTRCYFQQYWTCFQTRSGKFFRTPSPGGKFKRVFGQK